MQQNVRTSGRNEFSKRLPRSRVDPLAQIMAVFDMIDNCYAARLQIEEGQWEFEIVRRSAVHLLSRAHSLVRLDLWDDLTMPKTFSWDLVPESDMHRMRERIDEWLRLLERPTPTANALLEAMDTVDDAFRSMHALFTYGYMSGHGPSTNKRYYCAALLKPVVDLLNRIWLPIRLRIGEEEAVARTENKDRAG